MPIWSTNVNSARSSTVEAVLLDNGNLVLNDGPNLSEPLWESFDHPTDTLLPGCKFGYNKKTKRKQVITSWKNLEDPAPGLFSIEPMPSEKSFVIQWNRSRMYWSSGSWNGLIFDSVPEMSVHNDDKNNSKSNVFEVEEQAFVERNDFCVYDSSWVETTMESTGCSLVQADDMAVSDWYANDGAVEVVEFEYCNGSIGDYSYLSNEMTYSCLWEQDN